MSDHLVESLFITMIRHSSSFVKYGNSDEISYPFHDAMDSLRKSFRGNFEQVVAQRSVGFFMDFLENERFFKGDFSRLGGLTKPKIFDEENLPLVDLLALNSLNILDERSRRGIFQIAA